MKKIFFQGILLLAGIPILARDQHPIKQDSTGVPIDQMIDKAIQTGKKDTIAAALIFNEAIARANSINDASLAGKAYYEMGQMYFDHKNHNHSFGAFFNARECFVKAGARKETAYALFGMGRQQYLRGNYKMAAGHLNFAMREARLLKIPGLEADALEYLGLLYHILPGTDQHSIAHFKRSYLIKSTLNDRKGMLRMLQKLADVYYQQKYFDSALQCFQQCIDMAGMLGLDNDANISRLDHAGTLIRLNKMKEANIELQFIAFEADTSDYNIRIRYYIQRAHYLTAQKKYEEGRNNYETALAIANQIGVPEMYAMVYKQMAEAYSDQGLYKEAFAFLQQYNELLASYYPEHAGTIKELEYIFNTSLTKDEIAYLNGENNLKARLLQNERKLSTVLLTGTAVLLLLAAIIFYLYRKQKSKNSIIKKQADELNTLMQEIHHRVKNNLQIISSLLDLQSTHIADDQAVLAIKESRNRVNSMALIHQHLYGEKNNQNIAIDEYITNLTKNLFYTYNIQPGRVTLKTNIERLNLDIDTVVLIGLILNELISNSLKHAFEQNTTGNIEVVLKKSDSLLFLQVKDNGKGFPQATGPVQPASFGMRLLKLFAQKLKADLEMYNDRGACVAMRIQKFTMGI